MPLFSILLATRDRPVLFAEALASVLAQRFEEIEVVVVDDGSASEHLAAYEAVLAPARERLGGRFQLHRLPRRDNGHGQSYSLNVAATAANGDYLAILDDDDSWTDDGHLGRAARSLAAAPDADLYMTNQRAFRNGEPASDALWLAGLAEGLAGRPADREGSWRVGVEDLLAAPGFAHVNCLIVRRALWAAIGGMDEGIRWECDRDLFLRLIDAAGTMLHNPAFVARHNIPDPAGSQNMTTALPMLTKRLHQLRVVDKAALFARHPAVRAAGRRHRAWVLQKIADELAASGDWTAAAHYARAGLGAGPSLGWAAKTAWISGRALAGSRRKAA